MGNVKFQHDIFRQLLLECQTFSVFLFCPFCSELMIYQVLHIACTPQKKASSDFAKCSFLLNHHSNYRSRVAPKGWIYGDMVMPISESRCTVCVN